MNELTVFFICLNIYFIALSFVYLHHKKKVYFTKAGIKKSIELWLSKILLQEDESSAEQIHIPLKFEKHFRNKTKREFTVNQLIDIKKNLSGKIVDNIVHVYQLLGFKADSVAKLKSGVWHKKAKGIHELYMMDQQQMLTSIYKYTNSNNQFIRMKAQAAIIHFEGFEGLRFLDMVTHPISEWEQLKLLEQLKVVNFGEMKSLGQWLKSSNFSVVLFALKLVDTYQEFQLHDEVAECLQHENEKVRARAIMTLGRIANEHTPCVLINHYYQETQLNKDKILQCLLNIASDREIDFLVNALHEQDDSIKLAAARVIAKCCTNGLQLLKERANQQPEPYSEIYFHVKHETFQ